MSPEKRNVLEWLAIAVFAVFAMITIWAGFALNLSSASQDRREVYTILIAGVGVYLWSLTWRMINPPKKPQQRTPPRREE
jgi:hypothetical protein